jgi:hypothetical protein
MWAVIGVLLIASAFIAAPVAAATVYQGGLTTQSYRSFTKVNPVTLSTFTSTPPPYLYGKYANLNNYLSGSLNVNTNTITVPSIATSNNDWDTLFSSPSFMYSCGCG